ncbi:hypothetical protein CAEBREN_07565 [Caenorhabditis brenneri]|uniref:C-type lectin domain-containing protein n=1 Tax=Caenorhabditis brenneri TaxID=135651 RepID=G0P648_CAEBE|nr:hypothetical protein CAEBREN_07565 [Caenorhabditis brenneri]
MLLRFSIILLLLLPLVASIFYGGDSGSDSESRERSYSGRRRHKHKYYDGGYYDDDNNRPPRPPPRPTCEEGWTFFQRPSGGWCMKVYPGTLNQYNSETMCVSHGAVLSGLQNTAEINWLVSSALSVIAPQTSGGVWIGTRRRPECVGYGQTATCTKTNTFYWTDNSTTGIEGMIFQQGEPNNGNSANGQQDCALMTVATTPTINAVSTYWSGQMDDIMCIASGTINWPSGTLPRANRAYVCGKKARQ